MQALIAGWALFVLLMLVVPAGRLLRERNAYLKHTRAVPLVVLALAALATVLGTVPT